MPSSARPAENMDGQDPARPGPGGARHQIRIQTEAVVLDIDEARPSAFVQEAIDRRHEAERGGDHVVAGPDPKGSHGHMETGRPAAAGDPEAAAGKRRDRIFEPSSERA